MQKVGGEGANRTKGDRQQQKRRRMQMWGETGDKEEKWGEMCQKWKRGKKWSWSSHAEIICKLQWIIKGWESHRNKMEQRGKWMGGSGGRGRDLRFFFLTLNPEGRTKQVTGWEGGGLRSLSEQVEHCSHWEATQKDKGWQGREIAWGHDEGESEEDAVMKQETGHVGKIHLLSCFRHQQQSAVEQRQERGLQLRPELRKSAFTPRCPHKSS